MARSPARDREVQLHGTRAASPHDAEPTRARRDAHLIERRHRVAEILIGARARGGGVDRRERYVVRQRGANRPTPSAPPSHASFGLCSAESRSTSPERKVGLYGDERGIELRNHRSRTARAGRGRRRRSPSLSRSPRSGSPPPDWSARAAPVRTTGRTRRRCRRWSGRSHHRSRFGRTRPLPTASRATAWRSYRKVGYISADRKRSVVAAT